MATKKPMKKPVKRVRRFQEGGEAALKAEGLAASNKTPMGFFERLRMGNIDQEGSEAYNRLGAGRGRGERAALSELAGMTASNMGDASQSGKGLAAYQQSVDDDEVRRGAEEMMRRGREEGDRDYKRMTPSLAQTQIKELIAAKPAKRVPAKASAPQIGKSATGSGGGRGAAAGEEDAYRASRAAAPATAPAAAAAKPTATSAATTKEERQARIDQAFKPPSDEQIQQGLEAGTLGAGFTLKKVADLAKNLANRKSALKDRLRLDRPGTVSGEGFVMRDGKMVKDIATKAPQKALPSPVTDVTAKNVNPRSVTGSAREDAKADRFRRGLEELSAKQMAEKNLRERGNKFLFADDAMKRGGKVKKMAHGGSVKSSVSTASKRGDGIALRGKTRGNIY